MICIDHAKKIIKGEVPFSSINSFIKPSTAENIINKPTPKSSISKLSELKTILSEEYQNSHRSSPESKDSFQKHLNFLSEIVNQKSIKSTRESQLCETLYELAKMKISIEQIHDSRIQNVLKAIAEGCKKSISEFDKLLGDAVECLRRYWKDLMKTKNGQGDESFVRDKSLRRLVCIKIANVFEINRFERAEARELAISIEKKIRGMDPSMTKKYKLCYRKMIREIQIITPTLFQEAKTGFQ